jgi:hypothetical protein
VKRVESPGVLADNLAVSSGGRQLPKACSSFRNKGGMKCLFPGLIVFCWALCNEAQRQHLSVLL